MEIMKVKPSTDCKSRAPRLAKAERHQQLLETALQVVRNENVDRLTLGYLAVCAGVSKPVVYDHFATRSELLIELYRWIDIERIRTFTEAMANAPKSQEETIKILASAYVQCAADKTDSFHSVGAALAGSEEKTIVYQELLENCVNMFISVLTPHVNISPLMLKNFCIGLIGAGEALSVAITRDKIERDDAIAVFALMINGIVQQKNA